MEFIARNKKYQSALNRAISWQTKYVKLNDQRDCIDGEFGSEGKEWRAINKKCENAWDKYEDACDDLPAYEIKEIEKSDLYRFGVIN
tara:strand:+ start:2565 stop:2825 length:261 start_codon:yes stop_codon:yes gene_type:complete